MVAPNSPKSIYIDRINWDFFLADKRSVPDDPFFQHMLFLNRKLVAYEIENKCIVMDVRIDNTDPYFSEFKCIFCDQR